MQNKNLTISFERAQEIILDSVSPLEGENASIMEVSNRVLYEDIVSDVMIPVPSSMFGHLSIRFLGYSLGYFYSENAPKPSKMRQEIFPSDSITALSFCNSSHFAFLRRSIDLPLTAKTGVRFPLGLPRTT